LPTKSYAENEKKRRVSHIVQAQENIENVENVPEIVKENIISEFNIENDQTELLYEEITKLDQKLAVTKSTSKIAVVEDIVEKPLNKRIQAPDNMSAEKGNRRGSYTKQAVKKTERHLTPLVGRVNRQNPNQASEIHERRQTVSNLSVQQEQSEALTTMEPFCGEGKKSKYDYSQSIQMRIKYAEEAARKQSIVESTEWILNAKLPLYVGKPQDKTKKTQG